MRSNLIIIGAIVLTGTILVVKLLFSSRDFYRPSFIGGFCDAGEEPKAIDCEKAVKVEEFVRGPLEQNDPRIIEYILKNGYLEKPPGADVRYNLSQPTVDPSMGQSEIVRKIFKDKRGGFFIECGALDGETRSNTLALERDLGWKGLLVEGDPANYELVRNKNRKAWTAGCCLAVHPHPHEVIYKQQFNVGKIDRDSGIEERGKTLRDKTVRVQCFTIFSLLSAMGVTTVDYFSLDVEGFEMDVLRTIPFHRVDIKVLTVEFTHGEGGTRAMIDFMSSKGYNAVTQLTHQNNLANDVVFVRKDFPLDVKFPDVIPSEKRKAYLDAL